MGSSKVNAPDAGQSGSAEQGLTALVTHGGPAPHLSTSRKEGTGTRIPRRTPRLLIQHVESHSEICGFATKVTHFHQEVKFFSDILKIVFRVHLATNISSITSVRDSSKYADRAPKVSSFGFIPGEHVHIWQGEGRGRLSAAHALPRSSPPGAAVPGASHSPGEAVLGAWVWSAGVSDWLRGREGRREGETEATNPRFPPKIT